MALLEVENLVVRYGKALALEGVTLSVGAGELVGVLGANGAGKTTLLKAIARAVPAEGRLDFDGASLLPFRADQVVGRGISHCPEGRRLFPELTVRKNLMLGAYARADVAGIAADLERMYTLFPILRERATQLAGTLSGGQQQMVAIARALMARPKLLLLDEPSTGLAHLVKQQIFEVIHEIKRGGVTVLLVEQDAAATLHVTDRVYVLEHGRIAMEGAARALHENERVRQLYLGVD
ncbi:MAG: ABC transporter ATP-binding protein [Sulfurifustaceae bacterium]